jgi:hypothetical protein
VHTNDMLTSRRLCVCVELETHFISCHSIHFTTRYQKPHPKNICACERMTFTDACEVIVQLSIRIAVALETTMSLFWAIFGIEN